VPHFSSVQFACSVEGGGGLAQDSEWQRVGRTESAHAVSARQALQLRVTRAPPAAETLDVARSLALDALQLVVVLTIGVATPVMAPGAPVPTAFAAPTPSPVSGWIQSMHCCGPGKTIFFGDCPLNDNYVLSSKRGCTFLQ